MDLRSLSAGTAVGTLNRNYIHDSTIAVPSSDEQKSIAAFLDRETERIDQLIAKKERQIGLLQEKGSALISHAVTKGLNPKAKMKDSSIEWLGEIPEHWKLIPLKRLLTQNSDAIKTGPFGSQLLSSEMLSGEVKVYNQRNIIDRDFDGGDNYISAGKYAELKAFAIMPGDVLVTTRGTIGRCVLFPEKAEEGILHPCLMRVQADQHKLVREYLSMLIQDGGIVQLQLALMSNATTIAVIYSETLKNVLIPTPPINEQRIILSQINESKERIELLSGKVAASIEKLQEYRTAIISAAVTGKIDVREEVA
jgi:type I restriction enzyme, S subunit